MPVSLLLATALVQVDIPFRHMLVVGPVTSGGRVCCPVDPVAYQMVKGRFEAPVPGEAVKLAGGKTVTWKELNEDKDGWLADDALAGGYAWFAVQSPVARTALLEASGHSMVYVNNEPRGGDPYGFGYVKLPVQLRRGRNEFLFAVGRGRVRARLSTCPSQPYISPDDPTSGDACVGVQARLECASLVVNPTDKPLAARIRMVAGGRNGEWWPVRVSPMTVRKVRYQSPPIEAKVPGALSARLQLQLAPGAEPSSSLDTVVEVKGPGQVFRRTFVWSVDGSVQYYAVQPASQPSPRSLVLSLHGAGVEATGQAAAYGAKPWCNIVCPTNGRPYGFDWEDWGRRNALEALEDARKAFQPDPDRLYLTGHSMGGHGTWSVGLNRPDLWAAIAPCAGWISFWSYGGAGDWPEPDSVEALLRRASNASDTLKLLDNARLFGVYILHGGADETVPVEQAREMRKRLAEVQRDVDWHEEPGQGHWFDTDPEPGANVEDYAPLFDFLARHRRPAPAERRYDRLTTANPSIADRVGNVRLLAQSQALLPSRIEVRTWADQTVEELTTVNVAALEVEPLAGVSTKVTVDGAAIAWDGAEPLRLERAPEGWKRAPDLGNWKESGRSGPFKEVFANHVALVYGTHGSAAENAWSYAKARYDAETWWYRGNGSFEMFSDTEFRAETWRGNVVLYGNARTNDKVKALGDRRARSLDTFVAFPGGDLRGDLGVLSVCAPEPGQTRLVGVVGGTTLLGCRATDRLPVFLSGAHFPDLFVIRPEAFLEGSKSVAGAGFLGPDWSEDRGQFARR